MSALEYFLGIDKERIRKLTEEEAKALQDGAKPILLYSETMHLYRMVELNYKDLLAGFDKYRQKFGGSDIAQDHLVDISRLLANFLSLFKAYMEIWEAQTKQIYGRKVWDNILEKFHKDEEKASSAYRLVRCLRNFAVHFAVLPSGKQIRFGSDMEETETKYFLSKSSLLSKYSRWGDVKKDLKSFPEQIEIEPLIQEAMKSLSKVDIKKFYWIFPSLSQALSIYKSILRETEYHPFSSIIEVKKNGKEEIKLLPVARANYAMRDLARRGLAYPA